MSKVRAEASQVTGGSHEQYMRYLETPYLQRTNPALATVTANRCYYSPVQIPFRCTVDGVIVFHRTIANGNVMTALYESTAESPTNRLAVSQQVICNGTVRKQFVPFTALVQVGPSYNFMSMWSSTTDEYIQGIRLAALLNPAGVDDGPSWYYEAAGGGGPPAAATPTQATAIADTVWMMLRVISIP